MNPQVRELGIRRIRKLLIKAVLPLTVVPFLMLGSESAANAGIATSRGTGFC